VTIAWCASYDAAGYTFVNAKPEANDFSSVSKKDTDALSHNTQASFNIMRYKGRDSASGIDRKLSIIRPGATTIVGKFVAP
jgi:hypothetical protein